MKPPASRRWWVAPPPSLRCAVRRGMTMRSKATNCGSKSRGQQRLRLYASTCPSTKFGQHETEGQLREIVKDGISSFKIFLAYKDFFGVDDGEMYQTLTLAKKLGVIVTAHCENAELVSAPATGTAGRGKIGSGMARAQPPGIGRSRRHASLRYLPGKYGCRRLRGASVLRTSLKSGAWRQSSAASEYSVESVIPHFMLDKTYAERPGVEGMKHVMSPPFARCAQPAPSFGTR